MEECKIFNKSNFAKLELKSGSVFEDCEFWGLDFSGLLLKSVSFVDCRFVDCNLANQILTNTSMRACRFEGCNLIGINWCALRSFQGGSFVDCKLNFASFQGLKLKGLKLQGCLAVEVDFSEADLSGADFSGTGFSGANFTRAVRRSKI